MMKRKLLTGSVAGIVVLGGAIGVGAAAKSDGVHGGKKAEFISTEDAKEIAINEFGGKLKKIELEKEGGRFVYDIELVHENNDDIDLDINAVTGEILKVERDDDDDYESDRPDTSENVSISLEKAINAALKDTPGKLKEAEYDDGYYEIEIKTGQNEVEMKIDGDSGKIIEKETDRDDD